MPAQSQEAAPRTVAPLNLPTMGATKETLDESTGDQRDGSEDGNPDGEVEEERIDSPDPEN